MQNRSVLFICDDGTHLGLIAASLAKHLWGSGLRYELAAVRPEGLDKGALAVLNRHGVESSVGVVRRLEDLIWDRYSVVVTLTGKAEELAPELPRSILKFYWALPNAAKMRGSSALVEEMYERVFTELEGNLKEIAKYVLQD